MTASNSVVMPSTQLAADATMMNRFCQIAANIAAFEMATGAGDVGAIFGFTPAQQHNRGHCASEDRSPHTLLIHKVQQRHCDHSRHHGHHPQAGPKTRVKEAVTHVAPSPPSRPSESRWPPTAIMYRNCVTGTGRRNHRSSGRP